MIGGLTASTLLTLVVIPAVYALFTFERNQATASASTQVGEGAP